MTNERHDNLTLDESLTDPTGKTLGTNSPLATESQLGTADGSVHSALSNGKAIGVDDDPTNGTRVNDFTNFSTDDAALQDIIDWIETNGVGGRLYFPARRADGNNVVIENTVSTSDDVEIPIDVEQRGGGRGQNPTTNTAQVETTIDNGDPMFRLTGDIPGTSAIKRGEFIGEKWDLDGQDATLLEVEWWDNGTIRPGYVFTPGGHIVHLKGFADGNFIDWINTNLGGGNNPKAAIFLDHNGLSNPGADNVIGPRVKMDGTVSTCIRNDGFNRTRVMAHSLEGANGEAAIVNEETGTAEAQVFIYGPCQLASTQNGAHGLLVKDRFCIVHGVTFNQIDGDCIRFATGGGTGALYVGEGNKFDANGDAINFVDEPGGFQPSVVPDRNTVKGTVSYPTGGSTNVWERNATQL